MHRLGRRVASSCEALPNLWPTARIWTQTQGRRQPGLPNVPLAHEFNRSSQKRLPSRASRRRD
jgi:hypothetical protein